MTTKQQKTSNAKILAFDVETTDLDANRGHIICAAAKWVGNKTMYTWRVDEGPGYRKSPASFYNDKHIVTGLIPFLEEADAVLAYYGTGFDVPYINTRAFANGVLPPAPYTLIDPWRYAKARLKLARNSMDSVSALLGVRAKTHLPWADWQLAKYGDSAAIDKLLKYNVNDVHVLEAVYLKLRPLITDHPYIGDPANGAGRCPACGSAKSRSLGVRRTKSFEIQRRRCDKCHTTFCPSKRKIA